MNTATRSTPDLMLSSFEIEEDKEPSFEELSEIEKEYSDIFESNQLSAIEETSKAYRKIFENGTNRYCDEAANLIILDSTEIIRLAKERDAGNADAIRSIIEGNLLLVVKIATKYSQSRNLNIDDLIQEGNLGLFKAATRFEWEKGYRFSTYATYWIHQSIRRGIDKTCKTIKIPYNKADKINKIIKAEADFFFKIGRTPTRDELATITGLKASEISVLRNGVTSISLSTPIRNEDNETSELGDFIPDENVDVAEEATLSYLHHQLPAALNKFLKDERAVYIITRHYGLDGSPAEKSFAEIGKELGITRQRAQDIEKCSLKKLREDSRFKKAFKDFL